MLIGVFYFIPILPIHAYTNNIVTSTSQTNTSTASFTYTSVSGINAGDLQLLKFVSCGTEVTGQSSPYHNGIFNTAGHVTTVTDVTGDTWTTFNSQDVTGYKNTDNCAIQVFSSKALSTTTGTITVTLSQSTATVFTIYSDYNTDATAFYSVSFIGSSEQCSKGVTYGSGLYAGTPYSCNNSDNSQIVSTKTLSSGTYNLPSDSLTIAIAETSCGGGLGSYQTGNGGLYNAFSNYLAGNSVATSCITGQQASGYALSFSYLYTPTALQTSTTLQMNMGGYPLTGTPNSNVYQSYSCTVNLVSSTCFEWDNWLSILIVNFNGQGGSTSTPATIYNNGCSFNPIANVSTHYGNLKSNQTVFFYGQSTTSQIFLNLTFYIKSVTAQSIGDILNVNIYTNSNQNGITNANPLNLVYTAQSTLRTTSTAFKVSLLPNIALPNNGQYAFGLSSKHNGIIIYRGNTGLTLYNDTADGYNPLQLTTLGTAQTYSMCMFGLIALPAITINVSGNNNGGTVTITSVITNLASPVGGALIISDLVTFLPFWILPLLFTALLRTTAGLLYGLMIALMLGIFIGLIPYWTIFIVILMIYLLLR